MNRTVIFASIIASLLIIIIALVVSGKSKKPAGPAETGPTGWVGQKTPDFELIDFEGKKITRDVLKGKNVVLFFTEGLMCYPACWDQMAKLGADERFNNDQTLAYSVIVDSKSDWQKAFEKMPELRQTKVLFDTDRVASRSFKALDVASSMHRGAYPGHTYFLIDKEGVIRFYLDDPQMGIRNDLLYEALRKIP